MSERCKNLIIAAAVCLVLAAVAIYREPVEVGRGRIFLLVLFKFGAVVLFGIFLAAKIGRFAVAFMVLAFFSSMYPAETEDSVAAFKTVLFGLCWYSAFIIFCEKHDCLIGYTLCFIASIHAIVILIGSQLMTNPNENSAFLAMCAPSFLLLRKYWKILIVIPITGIFYNPSFNGKLAILLVLCLYGVYSMPKYWYVYVLSLGVLLYFYNGEILAASTSKRLSWWIPALKGFWAHPEGCGLGNWKVLSSYLITDGYIPQGCLRLHNTWIQNLVEMGRPFAIWLIAYGVYVVKRLRGVHVVHVLGILAFLIVSNTNSLFRMNIINGLIAIALLARVEICFRRKKNELSTN